jgi:hypothetical protein
MLGDTYKWLRSWDALASTMELPVHNFAANGRSDHPATPVSANSNLQQEYIREQQSSLDSNSVYARM